jgi:Rrf2 family transcriptional regulator, iron-sulfur cluster assembly transcription factor
MLSITAEHALRALSEMASLEEGESILGKDLARIAGIPANYLSKLLLVLGNAGIIDATRGSGGGYRLRRKTADIRLIEVVELFDRQKPECRCLLGGTKECSEEDPCGAHEEWRKVRASYVEFLGKTTLAQITHRHRGNVIPIGASESPT